MFSSRRTLFGLLAGVALLAGLYFLARGESKRLLQAREAATRRDFVKAVELLQVELGESGGSPDTLLFAARTARRAGQPGVADRYLRRYAEHSRADAEIFALERILVGIQLGELDRFNGGLQFCDQQPQHPQVPFVLEAMAQGYLKAGHIVGALEASRRWLATQPLPYDAAEAHTIRGTCLQMIGNLDDARQEAQTALQLAPELKTANALLGELLTRTDPATALNHWQAVLAQDADNREAKLGLVRCYRNLGEPSKAFQLIEEILVQKPNAQPALLERAKLHLDAKSFPEAIRDAQTVLAYDAKSRAAMTILAQAYQATGRETDALKLRQQVKDIENALYKIIQDKVQAGTLPAPQKGIDINIPETP